MILNIQSFIRNIFAKNKHKETENIVTKQTIHQVRIMHHLQKRMSPNGFRKDDKEIRHVSISRHCNH